jgi:beta-galactosidase
MYKRSGGPTSYLRGRILLDRNWRFALGHAASPAQDFEFARSRCLVKAGEGRGAASPKFDDSLWRPVDLPHDWAIELPIVPPAGNETADRELAEHGFHAIGPDYPQNSVGWYRRKFKIAKADLGRRISVEFDGVFRDSIVWINGHRLGRHESGYTSFRYDLTDYLNYGTENVLTVRVDATSWEGWWYEGAGIYRHVRLTKTDPLHIAPNGIVVIATSGRSARVNVRSRIVNESEKPARCTIIHRIRDANGKIVATARSRPTPISAFAEIELTQRLAIRKPRLWSCDDPYLYHLETIVKREAKDVDSVQTPFGVRSFRWDAKRGFFLNGHPLKIKGTCNHQQHAGVGIALPDAIQEFRIKKLKELGSNAYRCSHYAATRELLDLCDRYGLLVMAENRLAGSGRGTLDEFRDMILRDRNHPSIFMWSIANEEHTIQWSVAGERIGRTMVNLAHQLDPTRPVTAAMHDRGLNEGFANVVDVHGWNYINMGNIEAFHKRRPKQPIVGSEEGSTVTTRGIYADDSVRGYVSAYDRRAPKWGSTAEAWWTFFAQRPWLAGGFVWTGFDYFGEPIPFKWPCTASHFGLMDLCGFPKDIYYYYKSWWSDQPVLHLFPHWNWPDQMGQPIDVRCFSNCDEVELILNGQSLGRKTMPRNSHLAWNVDYQPGTLEARGFKAGRQIAQASRQTTGVPALLSLQPDRARLAAGARDVAVISVTVCDDQNRPVPTADNLVQFEISGLGQLIGVGNGDPSSHESSKAPIRRAFGGLCMALVQSTDKSGEIRVEATSPALTAASILIRARN